MLLSWVGLSGQNRNLLMDGGVTNTYTLSLKREIQTLLKNGEYIDLLILSHIDSDHIGGILRLVNDMQLNRLPDQLIARCWFNSARVLSRYFDDIDLPGKDIVLPHIDKHISIKQGNTFENFLTRLKISSNSLPVLASQQYEVDGLVIDILSPDETGLRKLSKNWPAEINTPRHVPLSGAPTDYHRTILELICLPFEEDMGIPNGSSIALLATDKTSRILLLADAHPSTIVEALVKKGYSTSNPLQVDYVKVSHHGSKHNINNQLLDLIDCRQFIICSNGHNAHGLPHKEAMARIIHHNYVRGRRTKLIFNYSNLVTTTLFTPLEMDEYDFCCSYQNQLTVEV